MTQGYCPDCDSQVPLGSRPVEGQVVTCGHCGAVLQVTSLSPIELDWVYELDEDEDDEQYEYEYEVEYDDEDDDYDD